MQPNLAIHRFQPTGRGKKFVTEFETEGGRDDVMSLAPVRRWKSFRTLPNPSLRPLAVSIRSFPLIWKWLIVSNGPNQRAAATTFARPEFII